MKTRLITIKSQPIVLGLFWCRTALHVAVDDILNYHTHTQNMERKTMTTKQNKTKFRKESMHASQPVQSMSVKGMGRVRWS